MGYAQIKWEIIVIIKYLTNKHTIYLILGQFHLVNFNSTSNLSIPIPFFTNSFLTYYFLPLVGTRSTYMEYLLWVVYIPSKIVMEEIFLN